MNKKILSSFKHSVFILICILSFQNASAASKATSSSQKNDLSVSLGNLCEYIGKIQTNASGSTNVCSFLPALSTSYDYYFASSWALSPQVGLTIPKSGRDDNITRMTFFTLLNAKYKTTYVNLIAGAGLYFTRISGGGGETVLNNGNSTESFPNPKRTVYSRNFIVNLGASMDFTPQWSGELYTYIFNIEDSEERAFSAGVSVSYHFGEVL